MTELANRIRVMRHNIEAGREVHLPLVASMLQEAEQEIRFYKTVWVHTDANERKRAYKEWNRSHCPNCGEETNAGSYECVQCGWWGLGVNN